MMMKQLGRFVLKSETLSDCLARANKSTASSNLWLDRQRKDPYVKRAIKESYRARSAFKLLELNDKYKFLKPGMTVLDIGAAPGSWCQVAIKLVNAKNESSATNQQKQQQQGLVIGLDIENIEPLEGARLLPFSDITDPKTRIKVEKCLDGKQIDCILSDMAPNASGESRLDHDKIVQLQTIAFNTFKSYLKTNGDRYFVCKLWSGDSVNDFKSMLSKHFSYVRIVKPPSSRSDSAEIFLFCSSSSSLSSSSLK